MKFLKVGTFGIDFERVKFDVLCVETMAGKESQSDMRPEGFADKIRALLISPDLLLLDEATRSLDPQLTRSVWNFIKDFVESHNRTLVFATHRIEEAIALGTRVLVLKNQQIL